MADQARQAAAETSREFRLVDVSEQPELAARYRLFYPFMTVVDQTLRLPSPMPASELVRIIDQGVEFRLEVTEGEDTLVLLKRAL